MKIRQVTTCHTCRARKLGCDGKIPACTQCLASGRLCSGYQYDMIFVEEKPLSRKKVQVVGRHSKSSGMPANVPASVPSNNLPLRACFTLIIGKYAPWLMGLSAHAGLVKSPYHICGSWVAVLPKLLDRRAFGEVLPTAVFTLALSIRYKDSLYVSPSISIFKTHCLALNLLRKSLSRDDESFSEELVAASMCLNMVEFILPTWKEGRMTHLNGVGKLLQLAGPEKYSSGVSYQLFVKIRPLLIFGSFQSRSRSFLDQKGWQTIPFKIYPASPIHALLNHAAHVPALLESFDNLLRYPTDNNLLAAHEIWLSFVKVLELLSEWEQAYRLDIQHPPYWPTASRTTLHCFPEGRCQESLWFPNLFVANGFTHLWALQIVCVMHCQLLRAQFPELSPEGLSVASTPWAQLIGENIYSIARRICNSIEFLLQDEGGLHAEATTLFPLRVVYMVFNLNALRNKEQMDWCQGIVNHLLFKGVKLSSLL